MEAVVNRGPGAVPLGEIVPGSAGAEFPENIVKDAAMVAGGLAALPFLGRKQGRQPCPLLGRIKACSPAPGYRFVRISTQDLLRQSKKLFPAPNFMTVRN